MSTDPETMASRELYAASLRARIAATDKQIAQTEAVNAQLKADAATIARLERELAEARGALELCRKVAGHGRTILRNTGEFGIARLDECFRLIADVHAAALSSPAKAEGDANGESLWLAFQEALAVYRNHNSDRALSGKGYGPLAASIDIELIHDIAPSTTVHIEGGKEGRRLLIHSSLPTAIKWLTEWLTASASAPADSAEKGESQ